MHSTPPPLPRNVDPNDPDALDAVGHELLARAARIRASRRRAPVIDPSSTYTTAAGGLLPAGRTRRWLARHAHEIPGAIRTGGKRGRGVVWLVTHAQYTQWLDTTVARSVVKEESSAGEVVDLEKWIGDAGYRSTRGAR